MDKCYLRIENGNFIVYIKDQYTSEPFESDIEINIDDFDKYFVLQTQAKRFRLKETPTGNGLFDYIEEFTPEPSKIEIPKSETETLKEENKRLKLSLAEITEKQEKDKLEMQLALAELAESLSKGGKP